MVIRNGTEADILKASRLWLEMVAELRPDLAPNVDWWRRLMRDGLRAGTHRLLVADDGGRLVALSSWVTAPEPSTGMIQAFGQHFFVMKDFRGTGLDSQLFEETLSRVEEYGAGAIELTCDRNVLKYWGRKGFTPKHVVMRKEI